MKGQKNYALQMELRKKISGSKEKASKQRSDYLIKLTIFLDTVKAKLLSIFLDLKLIEVEPSAEKIKNIYLGKENFDLTILQLIDQAIKKYKKELAPGNLKNYNATRAYVEAYCKVKFKTGDIRLKLLNYTFIDGLQTFILITRLSLTIRAQITVA